MRAEAFPCRFAVVFAVLAGGASLWADAAPPPGVGPRGPVGPDVPLSDAEQKQLAKRVTVEGRTTAAVQAACDRALKEGAGVVFLPTGQYVLDATVRVPGGLTLAGEGAKTLTRAQGKDTRLFSVDGNHVRFTRLKMQGADATTSENNDTYGIFAEGKQDVRVDHCELTGFSHATNFGGQATAQVDHCLIHHNLREGLGYGVCILSGAHVLMADNDFSQNRHSLASNGALDWSSPKRLGKYVHKAGVRKTHWEFIHNRVGGNDLTTYELMAVDTHPGMDGTFVVEGNLFEDLRYAVGIRDGSGLIRANLFRNLRGKPFRPWIAISISYGTHNGVPVEGCMPNHIEVAENTFGGAGGQVFADKTIFGDAPPAKAAKYVLGQAENVTVEGTLLPKTQKDRGPAPRVVRLQPMGEDGVLRWRDARPAAAGTGSVTGTVTDEAGKPVPGAAVLAGERSAQTDGEGRFTFPRVSEAAGFLLVSKAGFEPAVPALTVRPGEGTTVNVRLLPDRTPARR
jgi:hypothetical protein